MSEVRKIAPNVIHFNANARNVRAIRIFEYEGFRFTSDGMRPTFNHLIVFHRLQP